MSSADDYEKRLADWMAKHGVTQDGTSSEPVPLFIKPDSEMDETLRAEVEGAYVTLMDYSGWAERFKVSDLQAHVQKHGLIATWDDFAKLGELESEDVE